MRIVIRQVGCFINKNLKWFVIFLVLILNILMVELWKFSNSPGQFKGDTIRSEVLFDNSLVVRLGVDGQELKILTKEYSSVIPGIIFLFLDSKTGGIINTLSVENYNIGPPKFRIAKGNKHDWFVVTRIDSSGTGYIRYIDDWYVMEIFGNIKKVLSYPSDGSSTYSGSFATYVENENYPNDSAIDIKFVVKNCVSEKDSCSKLSKVAHYFWDNKSGVFMFDQNKSDISEQQINSLLSN
ncbi:MAG: hypothetical protein AAB394_02440 [Patescibacteria group bacterium]